VKRRRFVVLDRDGTLIVHHHYLRDPEKVELLPEVAEGLRELQSLGLGLVVITNQSGVGRGVISTRELEAVHRRMEELLRAQGVRLDGIYVCPHRPEDGCSCRKPQPGLLTRAARELGFDPHTAWIVGDNTCDVELGRRIKVPTIMIRTPYGAPEGARCPVTPDYLVSSFKEVVTRIVSMLQRR